MKVLVVEDEFVSRQIMQRFLSMDHEVDIAIDGVEALEAYAKSIKSGEPYGLICLDIMMPRLDGQYALKRLRKIENDQATENFTPVKIMMTTSLADKDNVLRAVDNNCDSYLLKPVGKMQLIDQLERLDISCENLKAAKMHNPEIESEDDNETSKAQEA